MTFCRLLYINYYYDFARGHMFDRVAMTSFVAERPTNKSHLRLVSRLRVYGHVTLKAPAPSPRFWMGGIAVTVNSALARKALDDSSYGSPN